MFNGRWWAKRVWQDMPSILGKTMISAAVYTQTSDCEGEQNGLMMYDRKLLKFKLERLAALHRELIEAGK